MKRFLAASFVLLALVATAQAAIISVPLGNLVIPSAAPLVNNINVPGTDTSPIRAATVAGNWTAGPGNPFSNELRVNLNGLGNRAVGGLGSGAAFAFPNIGTTYNNTSWAGDVLTGAPVSGNHTFNLQQTFAGSSANLANAEALLLTDALAPTAGSLAAGDTTWTRPSSLTAIGTGGAVGVRYDVIPFIAPASGIFMLGLDTRGGTTSDPDGYLALYSGAFNPLSQLTNLIGLDDDGGYGVGNSTALPITLVGGQSYNAVVTAFSNTTHTGSYTLYIAGAPEPTTLALLALSGLAMLRRRR